MTTLHRRARPPALAAALLAWYDRHRRTLPWRAAPGTRADPYRVWLSEIMLQQTTVATVGPYFRRFIERWPSVQALADADLDEVLHAWAGLGYYARARNLHACARRVATALGGRFPGDEEGLRALPGIGPYTAAAIAAIVFDVPATAMDGNVERVIARLRNVMTPLPAAKPELHALASEITPASRAGDYAQAVMDLGATVCTPRGPRCMLCPWANACAAREAGIPERLPAKTPKSARPVRYGIAFWARRGDGLVLLRRRPEKGLLGGMMEVPSTEWGGEPWSLAEARSAAPVKGRWRLLDGTVGHVFTHFALELSVATAEDAANGDAGGLWCPVDRLSDYALPTVMKKVARHAVTIDQGG
ncbi:MAG: A/G-specific adenine glycosylase [Hyphomonadaceae bacterium]